MKIQIVLKEIMDQRDLSVLLLEDFASVLKIQVAQEQAEWIPEEVAPEKVFRIGKGHLLREHAVQMNQENSVSHEKNQHILANLMDRLRIANRVSMAIGRMKNLLFSQD